MLSGRNSFTGSNDRELITESRMMATDGDGCEGGILTDIEGNTYTYRKFGDAGYWMTQNLRTTRYSNGAFLPLMDTVWISDYTTKAYNYPDKNRTILQSHPEYGLLYTWAAATNGQNTSTINQSDINIAQVQGICPAGWHLPNDYEWNNLEKAIVNDPGKYSTGTNVTAWLNAWRTQLATRGSHGVVMKSSTKVVDAPPYPYNMGTSLPAEACGGGFDALFTGEVFEGNANGYGSLALFWSSSSYSYQNSLARGVWSIEGVYRGAEYRNIMIGVRCVKNN